MDETFDWLQHRLAEGLAEGQARDELATDLDTTDTAATIVAVLHGGYVLARAANSVEPFTRAINGVLSLLASHTKTSDGEDPA